MINNPEQIAERLMSINALNQRVAFDHFSATQNPPFAVYTFTLSSDGADDLHNLFRAEVSIELYQKMRDFELEKQILAAFYDVPVDSESEYIDEEKLYLTEYTFHFFVKN